MQGESSEELPQGLLASLSGLYANDAHPILNYNNILASLELEKTASYALYDEASAYGIGSVVRSVQQLYRSKKAQNTDALTLLASWEPTTHIAEELRKAYEAATQRMISELFLQKKLSGRSKQVLDDTKLFYSSGNRNEAIVKRSRFCGLEIVLNDLRDLALIVNEVGLQATQDNSDLPIYIYDTSKAEPLAIVPLTVETGFSFGWAEVAGLQLKENINGKYNFIIGYYEDDLVGSAISIQKDWTARPCSQCNDRDPKAFKTWNRYVKMHPFTIAQNEIEPSRNLFNLDAMEYDYKNNFGLNLRVSITCDITDNIVRNRQLFAPALQKWIAVVLLETMAYGTEVNAVAETMKMQCRYVLDPGSFTKGLKAEAIAEIKALDFDFSSANSRCIQNKPGRGIATKSA